MMTDKAAEAVRDGINNSVEAPLYPDQRDVETKLLATLATFINGDEADLKYDLLELDAGDFHFRDHRAIFVAMQQLADDGEYVDRVTVRAKLGDAWTETLNGIFDASKADAGAAMTYKRQVIHWANIQHARGIGNAFMAALDAAARTPDADLTALVADLQKAAFDLDRTDRIAPPILSQADLTDRFLLDLASPKPGLKTGFDKLDRIIRGLLPGLFVIAAPPSAGKTTYVLQQADQIAQLNNTPVLYFTYEQSQYDLWIKSVARLSKIVGSPVQNESIKQGLSSAKVEEAAREYQRFANWITVIEGDRQLTVNRIRLLAQREKMKTGKAPVLAIDYLQILPVDDPTQDKRVAVDFLVSDLRRIARDMGSPIIAISAMSRAEYDKVKMTGFKESGGIEYGTDIAAILTVEKENDDGTERDVALNIIKNRNGRRGKVGMKYDMTHDHFEETDQGFVNYLDTLGKGTDR
jgi:replicative DNA helicase